MMMDETVESDKTTGIDETRGAAVIALELLSTNIHVHVIKDDTKRDAVIKCMNLLRERKQYIHLAGHRWWF